MRFFPKLPSVTENFEWESNPIPQQLYLYLSGSIFFVISTDPNKQLFNVRSVFKYLKHGLSL